MLTSEQSFESLQPEEVVGRFYNAIYSGDLESVKHMMTQQSYFMTLESLGLKLAFKDDLFKNALESIEEDESSLQKVEHDLSKDLSDRKKFPQINIDKAEPNGASRMTIHYREDGKAKNLYFSKEKEGWKINYYAGRKVD